MIHSYDHVYPTYGTILPEGVRQMLQFVKIGPSDVFYDLGSGVGNVVVQVFEETDARKCMGIEMDAERHATALKHATTDFAQAEYRKGREMLFLKDNFMNVDLSDATVIYMCSTCFSDETLLCLEKKILRECRHLRCVASLRFFPRETELPRVHTLDVSVSWGTSSVHLHLYLPKTAPSHADGGGVVKCPDSHPYYCGDVSNSHRNLKKWCIRDKDSCKDGLEVLELSNQDKPLKKKPLKTASQKKTDDIAREKARQAREKEQEALAKRRKEKQKTDAAEREKEEEAKQKEEEAKQKEEEAKRKAEEAKRKEEEAKRKEEEARQERQRVQEERRRLAEEARIKARIERHKAIARDAEIRDVALEEFATVLHASVPVAARPEVPSLQSLCSRPDTGAGASALFKAHDDVADAPKKERVSTLRSLLSHTSTTNPDFKSLILHPAAVKENKSAQQKISEKLQREHNAMKKYNMNLYIERMLLYYLVDMTSPTEMINGDLDATLLTWIDAQIRLQMASRPSIADQEIYRLLQEFVVT